jgi:DNA-binding PadR family transcriptional regulator
LNTQDVILGLLHMRSYSGYEMKHYFEEVFSFFFDASYGTIYPTLSKMEQLGYITKENISQENRPNKNVYSLTSAGKEQFQIYLNSPVEAPTVRSDFLVRMFFGEFAENELAIKWVQDALLENIRLAENLEKMKHTRKEDKLMSPTRLICLQIGIESKRTQIEVLREGLLSLQKLNISDMEQGDQQ